LVEYEQILFLPIRSIVCGLSMLIPRKMQGEEQKKFTQLYANWYPSSRKHSSLPTKRTAKLNKT